MFEICEEMNFRLLFCSSISLVTFQCLAQSLFNGLDEGISFGGAQVFLEDTSEDVLYVGGAAFYAGNDVTSPGIFKWDGEQFHALGCGFNWDCVSQLSNGGLSNGGIVSLAFWNNELYAAGDIYSVNGDPVNHIARWDGAAWQPLAGGLDEMVQHIRAYPDGLYAVGSFTHADGMEANGLARWDGTTWHSVFDLPIIGTGDVNLLNDMAWYNGKLYIGGNFGGGTGTGLNDIACWDGTQWGPIGNGFLGVFSTVNVLLEHDGLLYVAGSFADFPPNGNPENPGTGILTWDGENWAQLGSGTRGAGNPSIYSLTWIHDTLYVSGRFDRIGDVPTGRVARWDGMRWCSLVPPEYFYPDIGPVGSYRDTLIVGGSFVVAGPDSINRIAKWVTGSYVDTCSTSVGLPERESTVPFSVFPNPTATSFSLRGLSPRTTAIEMHDVLGHMVLRSIAPTKLIDVGSLPAATYFVTALDRTGLPLGTTRLLKQ